MKQKKWKFFEWTKCKNNQTIYAYRGYASTYNVEISNLVNPELQVIDAESAIKNKLRNGLY